MYNAKVGWCHFCNQGWVSIVKTEAGLQYCLCEECETEWKSPDEFLEKVEGTHFVFTSAIALSDNDIQKSPWKNYVIS